MCSAPEARLYSKSIQLNLYRLSRHGISANHTCTHTHNIVEKNNAVFTGGKNNSIEITNTERVGMLCMASIAISMQIQQYEKCKWY